MVAERSSIKMLLRNRSFSRSEYAGMSNVKQSLKSLSPEVKGFLRTVTLRRIKRSLKNKRQLHKLF